jgi:hypothetical protein
MHLFSLSRDNNETIVIAVETKEEKHLVDEAIPTALPSLKDCCACVVMVTASPIYMLIVCRQHTSLCKDFV